MMFDDDRRGMMMVMVVKDEMHCVVMIAVGMMMVG